MLLEYMTLHGLFFGFTVTGYLLFAMLSFNPRVWGYQDYSGKIKAKIPPQTKRERRRAIVISIPFFLIMIGFPLYSLMMLKTQLGGELSFVTAFIHLLTLFFFGTIGDLVILDWLIISKITPRFVMIPGTSEEDYKDFSHHYRGHALAALPIIVLCVVIAVIVSQL
jgi:hypothetical protein